MASLRDKLRATAPKADKPKKPAAQDCYVKECRYSLADFKLEEQLSGSLLSLMQGKEYGDFSREDICFLDTETTGLSHGAGTVAFLVGIGFFEENAFVVRQYLMRDYDEETFVLKRTAEDIQKCKVLCTFNGATFDIPLLDVRFTMQRMRELLPARPHLDLLPTARRVWKLRLKKCNLGALEQAVLGMERVDDLPGAMVPERYFAFLKSKDFSLLEDILEHNEQDIVSLAHILHRLLTLHELPLSASAAEDIFSLGRIYEKRGKMEGARMCYRAADKGAVSAMARARMAETFRLEGDFEEAARVYERMIASRQGGAGPLIAMAKICEHRKRDIPKAIEYTRKAIILASDNCREEEMAALQKRYQRLLFKARRD